MAAKFLTCLIFWRFFLFSALLNISVVNAISEADQNQYPYKAEDAERLYPTVLVATLVRNKAHTLPFFFGHLESLDYPKNRIALWIRSDHNKDNSTAIIKEWIAATEHLYNSVEFAYDSSPSSYSDEKGPCDWPDTRFDHVIHLRDQALHAARMIWADYLLMIDADVILENTRTLQILMEQKQTIVAPMLDAAVGKTYSNFWGDIDENGYYKRVPEYFKVIEREFTGIYKVPMIHTVFLVDMRVSKTVNLSYIPPPDFDKAEDDLILFAFSAKTAGIPLHVTNVEEFGQIMVPMESYHTLFIEQEQFTYLRIETLDDDNPNMAPGVDYFIEGHGLKQSPHISMTLVPKDSLGFDKVYMINLERRPERRKRMLHMFDVLGIEAELVPAVDGKQINASYIESLGISVLPGFSDPVRGRLLNDTYLYTDLKIDVVPGFSDPYGGRPMTFGEIGCFLSHYNIWKDVVDKGYSEVVVFEDDLRFEPYFKTKLTYIMKLVNQKVPDWDLIYLGRKRLNRKAERYLENTDSLVWPSYSYWTLSYLLSNRGARKLLAQRPLQNLLPVDEYLPVMFDQHPEETWKEPFHPRNLIALSAEPLLIYPTHYVGDAHYISDTEYSEIITEKTDHNTAEMPQGAPIHETTQKEGNQLQSSEKGPKGDQNTFSSHFQDEL